MPAFGGFFSQELIRNFVVFRIFFFFRVRKLCLRGLSQRESITSYGFPLATKVVGKGRFSFDVID